MFTGIIRHLGEIESSRPHNGGLWLVIRSQGLFATCKESDSIAINGVCLTVRKATADAVEFELGPETVRKTTLAALPQGTTVNVEFPMKVGDAFDGHFVQGHVEGTAPIVGLSKDGETTWMRLDVPEEMARYTVHKGSIAVDGVSLTVAEKKGNEIGIMLMPYTVEHTNFSRVRVGDRVNIETDMFARHVAELMKSFESAL